MADTDVLLDEFLDRFPVRRINDVLPFLQEVRAYLDQQRE